MRGAGRGLGAVEAINRTIKFPLRAGFTPQARNARDHAANHKQRALPTDAAKNPSMKHSGYSLTLLGHACISFLKSKNTFHMKRCAKLNESSISQKIGQARNCIKL